MVWVSRGRWPGPELVATDRRAERQRRDGQSYRPLHARTQVLMQNRSRGVVDPQGHRDVGMVRHTGPPMEHHYPYSRTQWHYQRNVRGSTIQRVRHFQERDSSWT